MKNMRSQIILFLTIISMFALVITSGCLETPEATPAEVSSEALSKHGWVQIGDVVYESQEEEVSGTIIKINTAMVTYQDEQLGQDILAELRNLQNQYGVQGDLQAPTAVSHLMTLRIVLPGGIGLPSSITSGLIEPQITNMAKDNNIDNFKKVGIREITVKDGSTITATTYSGTINMNDGMNDASIHVMGIIALWPSSGSNIFVIGIVPDGDINMEMGPIEKTIITIDGNAEIEDLLELVITIE